MTEPLPIDPLDEPLMAFVDAVRAFLAFDIEKLEQPKHGPADGFKRRYEDGKKFLAELHAVFVKAEPELDRRHRQIAGIGSVVLPLTDDPYIEVPVRDLLTMTSADRVDLRVMKRRLNNAGSAIGMAVLLVETLRIAARLGPRRQQMATKLDGLTAYYLLEQFPPREPE